MVVLKRFRMLMLNWLCPIIYLVSMVILVSATDKTSKGDEMHRLREELQRNVENAPHNKIDLRQILELVTQAIKAQTESIESQDEKIRAQNEEIVALKMEIKEHTHDMIALTKRIQALERKQTRLVQTIRSKAREIESEKIEVSQGCAEKTHKEQQADDSKQDVSKRIVLHSDVDILSLVTTHSIDIKNLQTNMTKNRGEIQTVQNEVATMKKGLATKVSGSTYVRWGRKSCPSVNGTELVYAGFTGGSRYIETGAASNYLCLSAKPLWGNYTNAHDSGAHVYGTEYELTGVGGSSQFFGTNVHNEDAPCSVCRSSRSTVIIIPGRNQCYPGWTLEYKGYLVAGGYTHAAASEYVCLDDRPEVLQNGHRDTDGNLFYFVEGRCGALPCPPYIDGRELTCAVCTK